VAAAQTAIRIPVDEVASAPVGDAGMFLCRHRTGSLGEYLHRDRDVQEFDPVMVEGRDPMRGGVHTPAPRLSGFG
jgi:hypothetical protein